YVVETKEKREVYQKVRDALGWVEFERLKVLVDRAFDEMAKQSAAVASSTTTTIQNDHIPHISHDSSNSRNFEDSTQQPTQQSTQPSTQQSSQQSTQQSTQQSSHSVNEADMLPNVQI